MKQRAAFVDAVVAPVFLFVSFYGATLFVLTALAVPVYWSGLIAAAVATAATVLIWEKGKWQLGLFVTPRRAVPEFMIGLIWGALLVGACALLVVLTSDVRHDRGTGFPWIELLIIFIPAAVHEELLFRGYVFQKMRRWNRTAAILSIAFLFAALHFNNSALTWIGIANIFLGGILLGLAYELYGRLWFPIGVHLAWNVMSGPILGHEVSGYDSARTLLVERGAGQVIVTGGDFGIEGSVWMTLTEAAGILLLLHRIRKRSQPT
ncbi:MAG TPA: CPBP family intramembrane glutamic endopeptidase [Thermoanaerobaculia bacterium]|nr:CPBP family intramembrane glutamic endopeptidase [Thermoanaerobaculia bacterium]